jgi:predicted glycosyltransferase involved in capsule biosynthesis
MKIDLSDVALMIHFRRDVEQRLTNLETVMKFYRKYAPNLSIIIVNDDKDIDPDLDRLHRTYNCWVLFQQNSGTYWRTKAFNEAAKFSKRKYLIAGDTDVFINPKYILDAIKIFEQNPKVGVVYPYSGMFVHLKKHNSEEFDKTLDITPLEDLIHTLKPVPYFETENFLVAHPMSKGGSVMFSREAFEYCGGYNTNFIGWGFEDDEISNRYTKLGFELERVKDPKAIAWHLPHDNTVREKHPFYQQNYQHSEFVGHCTKEELENYIKTWKN